MIIWDGPARDTFEPHTDQRLAAITIVLWIAYVLATVLQ